MTGDPLTTLRHGLDRYEWARNRDEEDAALTAVEQLIQAARDTTHYAYPVNCEAHVPNGYMRALASALAPFGPKQDVT